MPLQRTVDGKNYFIMNKEGLEKFFASLECEYTDYQLVEIFGRIAEVFAPIHAIATRVANAVYEVRRIKDDSPVKDNKYLNDLLQSPNRLQNWQEFMYESVVWQYVTGKNYIHAAVADTLPMDYKNVSSLLNLWSYQVQVLHEPRIKFLSATKIEDIIKGYRLQDGSADIPTQKVLFSQFMSLDKNDNKINGRSPLQSCRKAIVNLEAAYEARGTIYTNRGALGLLSSELTDSAGNVALTPEQKKQVVEDYQNKYGVTNGKSPIGITDIPVKWIQIAMSIAELQPFDETLASAMAIYGVLDVPGDLMPTPKGSTFENQKIAERSLYQNVATPLAKSRAEALTNFLKLREAGLYLHASHDHIEVMQDNKKEKAETSKIESEALLIQYRCGAITMNQWIAKIGGEVVKNPLFDKRTLEMTKEELDLITPLLVAKSTTGGTNNAQNG